MSKGPCPVRNKPFLDGYRYVCDRADF